MTLDIETDFASTELRTLAAMLPWQQEIIALLGRDETRIAVDPAKPGSDKTVVVVGHGAEFFIVDEFDLHIDNSLAPLGDRRWFPIGEQKVSGTLTACFEDEDALKRLLNGKIMAEQPVAAKPDNRKQRRIDEAKARRKPRGQRKRVILDIETYDPNRTKDWLQ